MFLIQMKPFEELSSLAGNKTVIINCEGCREIYYPESEAAAMHERMLVSGTALAVITTEQVCEPEHIEKYFRKYMSKIETADTLLVFSCGVGVQTVAGRFENKPVYSAFDTFPLPGHQGLTPSLYDCVGCDECHLNNTSGICPITACAKGLINGQCGGSKKGKCEVDKDMDCAWEKIGARGRFSVS